MGIRQQSGQSGVWFASPWLVGLGLLYVGPMLAAAVVAMTEWDGLSASTMKWSGWANFRAAWADRHLGEALANSICYTAMNVPAQLAVGLCLALLVKQSRRRTGLWATLYYLPHVLGGVATILIWWWLLNPQVGPINRGLHWIFDVLDGPSQGLGLGTTRGWELPPWLYSPGWAKPSLVLMNVWQAGGGMLIFLAALLRGGEVLHEAAKLDGATTLRRFWHITLPQVSPAILFNAVTGVVFSMQAFSQPFLLRNSQQQDSLLFYVLYMYQAAFEQHRLGYAAALSWILLAVLLAFTLTAVLLTRRFVYYDMDEPTA
ncbi:MAG: sugar ABC transporter permease [Phycisphaerae bacterium]|nr:sugar ABC transporter permease [Phycisphaerae bacterium]